MRAVPWATCLWPGLAKLWYQGEWRALAVSVMFAAVFNLLLVSTFLWPQWLPALLAWIGWPLVALVWTTSAVHTLRHLKDLRRPIPQVDVGLFIQAQHEYLRGHWFEAETALQRLLAESRNDVPSLLLLATLYRRTRRFDEASQQLLRIEQLDAAYYWNFEIAQERKRLERGVSVDTVEPQTGVAIERKATRGQKESEQTESRVTSSQSGTAANRSRQSTDRAPTTPQPVSPDAGAGASTGEPISASGVTSGSRETRPAEQTTTQAAGLPARLSPAAEPQTESRPARAKTKPAEASLEQKKEVRFEAVQSGPTAAVPSSLREAVKVVSKHELAEPDAVHLVKVPASIRDSDDRQQDAYFSEFAALDGEQSGKTTAENVLSAPTSKVTSKRRAAPQGEKGPKKRTVVEGTTAAKIPPAAAEQPTDNATPTLDKPTATENDSAS